MNVAGAGAGALTTLGLVTQTWFRAVPLIHRGTPLGTGRSASRFCAPTDSHRLIYLARSPALALLEVQALARSTHSPFPVSVAVHKYWVFPVKVDGIDVVDFGDPAQRARIGASAQEMTGDWGAYPIRRATGSDPWVRSPRQVAPTQELGDSLHTDCRVAGFLAPSAYDAWVSNLIVFADKVTLDEGTPVSIKRLQQD